MHYIRQVLIIIFLFPCKNLPRAMFISQIMQLLFFIANSPKASFFCMYFHSCEVIDTFHVLMSSTFIPYLRVSVIHEIYMYQMAIKNSKR